MRSRLKHKWHTAEANSPDGQKNVIKVQAEGTESLSPGVFKLNDYRNQITTWFDQQLDQISKAELEWAPY